MDEDRIFGPLTLRQFLFLAVGALLVFFVYANTSETIGIPISILIAGVTMVMILRFKSVTIDEAYIQKKRGTLSKSDFDKWINKKIATIESQKALRESRGLRADPELDRASELFKKSLE